MASSDDEVEEIALDAIENRAALTDETADAVRVYVQGLKDEIKDISEKLGSAEGEELQEQVERLAAFADRLDPDAAAEVIVKDEE